MSEIQQSINDLEAILPLFDPVTRPTIHSTLERVISRLKNQLADIRRDYDNSLAYFKSIPIQDV